MKTLHAISLAALSLSAAASAQTTPAARLTLSAPVGTAQEYGITTKTRLSFVDAQVSALPGSKLSDADLQAARQGMPKAGDVVNEQTLQSKLFQKVTARDAAGNVTLLSTSVTPTGQGAETLTINTTMRLDPQGKATLLKMDSTNPNVQRVLAALKPDQLDKMAAQQSNPLYGTLLQNQPQTQQISLDAQNLLGGLLAPMTGGAGGEQLFKQIQATPLKATSVLTYKGQTSAGQLFDQTMTYQPWKVRFVGQAGMPTMQVEILSGQVKTQSTMRRDGLLSKASAQSTMRMRLTMEMDGVRNQMTMDMVQEIVTQAK